MKRVCGECAHWEQWGYPFQDCGTCKCSVHCHDSFELVFNINDDADKCNFFEAKEVKK